MRFVNLELIKRFLLGVVLSIAFVIFGYHILFLGRIYPNVRVAGVDVSGKTEEEAQEILQERVRQPEYFILYSSDQEFRIPLEELYFSYDFTRTVENAALVGREANPLVGFWVKLDTLVQPKQLPFAYLLEEDLLEERLETIYSQVEVPAWEPSVSIEQGQVVVNQGRAGRKIDTRVLKQQIATRLSQRQEPRIEIPVLAVSPQISDKEAQHLSQTAEKLLGTSLTLFFEFDTFIYQDKELVGFLDPQGGLDKLKIANSVANFAEGINRTAQNAAFEFRDGQVVEFRPAKDGVSVREDELTEGIAKTLEELISQIEDASERLISSDAKSLSLQIPVVATKPEITTEEVNNLGIKELIGRDSSTFRGSIAGRVHNIGLSSSRIHGALVAPGEVFSFNSRLGDISVYTGYQQAYIIKDGKTILGDGGGVCQVSTTFFRAALDAGLPIVERHQHSYRVSYYEQDRKPGFDATIYVPSIDLKVKNDTPGHILIQRIFNPGTATLVFEIYGTDDGRQVSISTPRVWDVKAPPPPLYQDDPTLPVGTTKQIDFAAWGAKAAFDYKVTRNGEVLQDRTFYSNFRPWQAVYLRGVGPAQ